MIRRLDPVFILSTAAVVGLAIAALLSLILWMVMS